MQDMQAIISPHGITLHSVDEAGDAAFGWQTWIWARLQSGTGKSKVFYYYFDQHPDYPEDSPRYGYGSPHGQDVVYVFILYDFFNYLAVP